MSQGNRLQRPRSRGRPFIFARLDYGLPASVARQCRISKKIRTKYEKGSGMRQAILTGIAALAIATPGLAWSAPALVQATAKPVGAARAVTVTIDSASIKAVG
ncbi:hypothetical protein GCM10007387_44190 [Pseudoduganella albidiflava]|uniref:Uncharacterized protein n=1 Tax=Pseudoduganella albidiflava TaxID=321983 RepID=A0AA88C4T7_9BURK|nr:hypothetical protein GCM10007387_44190 [Pseudoduganella albidiflava]